MYLARLEIEGFRRLAGLTVQFRPGLNVMVGPNNVGKTAVIDALRALLPTHDDTALRLDELDFHLAASGAKTSTITFKYVFRGLTEDEEADFFCALAPQVAVPGEPVSYEAHLAVRYSIPEVGERPRLKRWCGEHEENAVSAEMLEDLRAVYLQPLRNPASGLRPSRFSQLARLVKLLSNPDSRAKVEKALRLFDLDIAKEDPLVDTQNAVVSRHEQMLGELLKQTLKVDLTPPEFQRFAARLQLSVQGFEVEQNGLGYNNRIYMAVVLSELSLNPQAAYKALIVEEPEAHLHPQLQAVLLQYLQSKELPSDGEKAVQIFVTSHSPSFASIANIDAVVCIHDAGQQVRAFAPRQAAYKDPKVKAKLQRYLDVTRAELFFAKRIILVEGTAERFMLPVLAQRLKIDLRKLAVSVLSTDGLNFDAFLPLFGETALHVRVAVISDGDAPEYPALGSTPKLSAAAQSIQGFSNAFVSPSFALKTFEYDLTLHLANHPALLAALAEIHPGIAADLAAELELLADADKPAKLFSGMFQRPATTANVKKGQYGQALAQIVADEKISFTIPPYIAQALTFIATDVA